MLCLILLLSPLLTSLPDGRLDWTHRRARVVGAAHPQILSPTGDLTAQPLYPIARQGADARMRRLLGAIPYDHLRLAREVTPPEALKRALDEAQADPPLRFSDGSQHVHLHSLFAFLSPGVEGPLEAGPTGLLIRVEGDFKPAARLLLKDDEGRGVYVGAPLDPLNGGVIWVQDIRDARAHIGASPRKARGVALSAPGTLLIKDAPGLFAPGFTFIGGVAVWIKPEVKPKGRRR
ncbi:hypothetical protein KKF91_07445 [Myxococcota bacterium]|nr:hypothetical protein [Myxococcota bacterium]MBU1430387.1 hypothetical protein [Myxococcota bacterium]MBU1897691.1 hypothetical protein [Myxococcota bacterium]